MSARPYGNLSDSGSPSGGLGFSLAAEPALLVVIHFHLTIVNAAGADQVGAPTSAPLIADALTGILGTPGTGIPVEFALPGGIINIAASAETTWYGFAVAIVEGLKSRGMPLAVERIVPIATEDYPTKARRPKNSRLDLTKLRKTFGVSTPAWDKALAVELNQLASQLAP